MEPSDSRPTSVPGGDQDGEAPRSAALGLARRCAARVVSGSVAPALAAFQSSRGGAARTVPAVKSSRAVAAAPARRPGPRRTRPADQSSGEGGGRNQQPGAARRATAGAGSQAAPDALQGEVVGARGREPPAARRWPDCRAPACPRRRAGAVEVSLSGVIVELLPRSIQPCRRPMRRNSRRAWKSRVQTVGAGQPSRSAISSPERRSSSKRAKTSRSLGAFAPGSDEPGARLGLRGGPLGLGSTWGSTPPSRGGETSRGRGADGAGR